MSDVEVVGGKNASLGEMISQLAATGVRVPGGFATTAEAFRNFLEENQLTRRIAEKLEAHGFKCWIAPRDVRPGRAYGDEIIRGIERAQSFDRLPAHAGEELVLEHARFGRELALHARIVHDHRRAATLSTGAAGADLPVG